MNKPEESPSKRYKFVTLGCRTNQYETQAWRDQLDAIGFSAAQSDGEATLCIVNTCSVTEAAAKQSRQEIEKLRQQHPQAKVVVTGCAAEHYPQTFSALPSIDCIIANKEKEQLVAKIFPEEQLPEFAIRHFEAHTRAFVKVQDGCNSFCTYCIIPYVRGRSRSRPLEEILHEVEGLIANGYKEIVLTGINIGDFDGGDPSGAIRLAHLVRSIDALPGLKRLRLSSIDPDEVDEELTSAILEGKNTCPSLHLVLQSGSNVILKRMNRKYTRQIFLETVERLQAYCPDFTVTTDIIVGFPGETWDDFNETLEVVEKICFAKVHMFPFSPRERTKAASMPNQVKSEELKKRKQQLLQAAERAAYRLREKFIGRKMTLLLEGKQQGELTDDIQLMGHTANFLPVWLPSSPHLHANDIVEVELLGNQAHGLIGKVVA